MEFNEVVKNRYSCKKFSSRQVGKVELEDILYRYRSEKEEREANLEMLHESNALNMY